MRVESIACSSLGTIAEEIGSGYGEAGRERVRLLVAGGGAATASLPTSACSDRDRDRRLGDGAVWVDTSASTGAAATTGVACATCAFGLRPRPSALAKVERCSE